MSRASVTFQDPAIHVESLEPRRLCSAVPIVWSPHVYESQSNDTLAHAEVIPKAYDGVSRAGGWLSGASDKDVFRFDAWHDGKVAVSLTAFGGGTPGITILDSRGRAVAKQTATTSSFTVRAGQSYFARVGLIRAGGQPGYQFSLKQAGLAVPAARVASISRGVNLSGWFWNIGSDDDLVAHAASYFTDRDAQQLHDAGFRNVRLPVDVGYIINWSKPGRLIADATAALDRAIELLQRHGLAVIVSPFGSVFNDRVIKPDRLDAVLAFAHSWAAHLARFSPDEVILQTANEPAGDPTRWLPVQRQIAAEFRAAAPLQTILTADTLLYSPSPGDFGSLDALLAAAPLPDPNVVYGFHYYSPYVFTAQGLDWAWSGYGSLRYVPYPSDPGNVQWLIDALDTQLTDPNERDVLNTLRQYGVEQWNADTLRADLTRVKQWAGRNGVPVVADEFGAVADTKIGTADRDRWVHDVRATLQKLGIGWTMWDYAGDYHLATGVPGKRTLQADLIAALGLMG